MFNGKAIEQVFSFKYLGIEITFSLNNITFDNNDLITQHDLYKTPISESMYLPTFI